MTTRTDHPDTSGGHFWLPPNISVTRQPLPEGMVYAFRDIDMGELGRLVIESTVDGETRISSEVAGDPQDPMTAQRLKVFEPISEALTHRLETTLGRGRPTALPVRLSEPRGQVPVEEVYCEVCNHLVALVVFADEANDLGQLEDCARMMYMHYAWHNVPTWLIGPQYCGGPIPQRRANVLQVWPQHGPLESLRPEEFNPRIEALATRHCK
ncbi:hypothetical protein ALP66_200037 [Pseudomonas amygdali pv. photiniae]|uniref:TraT protein n=2 Tax=Pseudomonas amygdali TaxID=47877 RepID=A0A0N8RVZ7_PSEA0|nr:hypothetical protein [Pseudomonas amygdali]KPX66583.1 hypothetical protein ALO53_200018 [Pseudomonas amygdali pv. photiniae]RMS44075.1 hypothetical protein ALP66_200037 [Pseudomonas amygdali pv. photiniae]